MKLKFSSLAHQELKDGISYYENQHKGLGKRFSQEVEKASRRIIKHPKAWSKENDEIRKYLLHQHRKPNYWVDEYLS